jgi:TusE/DsrC/DsvC family sulfur relay protein
MPILEYDGKKIDIDEDGFLVDFEKWDEKTAQALAAKEGLKELKEEQMDILKFLRYYYKKYNFFPILRHVCKNVHQPKDCFNEQFINPVQAWKVAGLPNPGDEVRMFKSWEPLGT